MCDGVLCCRLWEVLWTGYPCPNFHLVVAVALLDTEKDTIMENKFGFTEILKVCVALVTLIYDRPCVEACLSNGWPFILSSKVCRACDYSM